MSAIEFHYKKKIKSLFDEDVVRVEGGLVNRVVFIDAIAGVDDTFAAIQMSPKQARRLAKALKKAARKAES